MFIIWRNEFGNVSYFINILNDLHSSITFTFQSGNTINFLDINLTLKNNYIETDIYFKPCSSKYYLPFNSFHPRHTKRNIPYNLAKRITTIVSNNHTRTLRLAELKQILLSQLYPINLINDAIKKL